MTRYVPSELGTEAQASAASHTRAMLPMAVRGGFRPMPPRLVSRKLTFTKVQLDRSCKQQLFGLPFDREVSGKLNGATDFIHTFTRFVERICFQGKFQ